MNKSAAYLFAKLTSIITVSILLVETNAEFIRILISALVFSCFILSDYIFAKLKCYKVAQGIILMCIICGCIYLSGDIYFPLLALCLTELCDLLSEGRFFYQITLVSLVLCTIIFQVQTIYLILTIVLTVGMVSVRLTLDQNEKLYGLLTDSKVENAELTKKANEMKTYVTTLRETTAMEERNRFAARIHDQLGHSISGSIIMLEAAQVSMDTNPQKAKEIINTATENLRDGVDAIRKSLREERPEKENLGLGELRVKLEGFKVAYGFETSLEVTGNTELIALPIWICVNENLGEALTNTLKHSKGNAFRVKIQVLNKLIRVEYADNGCCEEIVRKGMGLDGIEERTNICGGKCIFHSGPSGFLITNLFSI